MNKKDFNDLVISVKQAIAIKKGKRKPSRVFKYSDEEVAKIRQANKKQSFDEFDNMIERARKFAKKNKITKKDVDDAVKDVRAKQAKPAYTLQNLINEQSKKIKNFDTRLAAEEKKLERKLKVKHSAAANAKQIDKEINAEQCSEFMLKLLTYKNGTDIDFIELCAFLKYLGFSLKIKSNHYIFTRDGVEEIINIQPARDNVKPSHIEQIKNIIIKYNANNEKKDLSNLKTHASKSLQEVWNNDKDAAYDKL